MQKTKIIKKKIPGLLIERRKPPVRRYVVVFMTIPLVGLLLLFSPSIFSFFSDVISKTFSATLVPSQSAHDDFNCTQNAQEWTAPYTGEYTLETWGAAGGDNGAAGTGGKGGYSTGKIQLTAGTKLQVYVGCQGQTTASTYAPGGWNGGGQGGKYSSYPTGGGGGGTDMRLNSTALNMRLIVAGGGGGSGSNQGVATTNNKGGAGGGISGVNGAQSAAYIGLGGTQTAGGDTGSDNRRDATNGPGTFGQGGSMLAGTQSGSTTGGGGGGGWYGGGAGVWEGGGGGSGYVWTAATASSNQPGGLTVASHSGYYLTDTQSINGASSMPDPNSGAMTGRSGDGFARISYNAPLAQDFTCTNTVQTYTIPTSGWYKIETWGAQGGSGGYYSNSSYYSTGGRGGYATGQVQLTAGTQLYVYVGCQGEGWNPRDQKIENSPLKSGGFGGGGTATNGTYAATGGGGASDVRIGADSLNNRLIVAGGGGGGGNTNSATQLSDGGPGGGAVATTLATSTQFSNRTPGGGGTQTAGGANGGGAAGMFGVGANQTQNLAGGGGGGWYGGGTGDNSTGGGGGSGYALTSSSHKPSGYALGSQYYMTGTSLVGGDALMPATAGGTQTGQAGDGAVRIVKITAQPPVITLTGASTMTIMQGTTFNDPGATAADPVDGDLTSSVVVTLGGLNTNVPGTYTVTYTVTNSAGLSDSVTRTVTVEARTSDLTCTNAAQTWTAPETGKYRLETWGADGGAVTTTGVNGKGGYSKGVVSLTAGQTVYVYVGCKGENSDSSAYVNKGGFNGGGDAKNGSGGVSVRTGGGGASDVRVLADSLYNRIIVAGGGGGNSTHTSSQSSGHGGGTTGINGSFGIGGTQTAGGNSQSTGVVADFGIGGSNTSSTVGGGGGGWYGGGNGNGAGGGSGYVLTSTSTRPSGYFSQYASYYLSDTVTAQYGASGFVANPALDGNGSVRITYITTPTVTVLGANPLAITQGGTFNDPGATAADPVDGDLTSSIVVSLGGLNTSVVGSYTVTYSVTNSSGVMAAATRTVNVEVPLAYDFSYTGNYQTLVVPATGSYKLESWGAQGGDGQTGNYNGDYLGGKGGYSAGTVNLTAGQTLYVYVGGQGRKAGKTGDGLVSNSFNGGGLSDSLANGSGGWGRSAEGGGASDVRIGANSLYARVIVAAGGGGAGVYNFGSGSSSVAHGGAGGGASGVSGSNNSNTVGGGATQTTGGSSGTGYTTASGFGVGGAMILSSTSSTSGAGGGGGWYGGGVSAQGNSIHNSGGGGGSSWLYTSANYSTWSTAVGSTISSQWLLTSTYYLTNASTIAGNASMPNPAGGTMTGRSGNGYIKITKL